MKHGKRDAKTEAQRQIDREERESLKRLFETQWKQLGGPEPQEEFEFSPARGWRFDFAHVPTLIAVEIEGGTWTGGRHTRGRGYSDDCQKYNAAIHLGWKVFRFTSDMLANDPVGHLLPVIELIRETKNAPNGAEVRDEGGSYPIRQEN